MLSTVSRPNVIRLKRASGGGQLVAEVSLQIYKFLLEQHFDPALLNTEHFPFIKNDWSDYITFESLPSLRKFHMLCIR